MTRLIQLGSLTVEQLRGMRESGPHGVTIRHFDGGHLAKPPVITFLPSTHYPFFDSLLPGRDDLDNRHRSHSRPSHDRS